MKRKRVIGTTVEAIHSEEVKPILDIYINKEKKFFKGEEQLFRIAFNHDILAEEGLCKAKSDGWRSDRQPH